MKPVPFQLGDLNFSSFNKRTNIDTLKNKEKLLQLDLITARQSPGPFLLSLNCIRSKCRSTLLLAATVITIITP